MVFKNILFAITLFYACKTHSIVNLSFLQQQPQARKSGLAKIGVGAAFLAGAFAQTESIPVTIAHNISAFGGSALMIAGMYQIIVDILAEEEVKDSLYPQNHYLNTLVNHVAANKEFIAGAAFTGLGLILQLNNENGNVSDTAFACNLAGLTLMGAAVGSTYLPRIIAFFNK